MFLHFYKTVVFHLPSRWFLHPTEAMENFNLQKSTKVQVSLVGLNEMMVMEHWIFGSVLTCSGVVTQIT